MPVADLQLIFVGGPNGAGKSTFSRLMSAPDAIIFDVDIVIARIAAEFPRLPKKKVYEQATEEFFRQATQAVRDKRDFTLETNFRDEGLVDIAAQFKRNGYRTNLIYLTLEHIEQSMDRVDQRVADGGHFVDHKNIRENYDLGLEHLERFADGFDKLDILDGSGQLYELRPLLSVEGGRLIKFHPENLPPRIAGVITRIAGRFGRGDHLDLHLDLTPRRPRGR